MAAIIGIVLAIAIGAAVALAVGVAAGVIFTGLAALPAHNRRWFQWSLRTLFAVVTAAAILLYPISWIQQRHAILTTGHGVEIIEREERDDRPIVLRLFFEPAYYSVVVRFYADNSSSQLTADQQREVQRVKKLFPEATHVTGVVYSSAKPHVN